MDLLSDALYVSQQEVLISQLLGLPAPMPRLEWAREVAPLDRDMERPGPTQDNLWAEPVPQGLFDGQARAQQGDSDSSPEDVASNPSEFDDRPRHRRDSASKARARKSRAKLAARPRPGGIAGPKASGPPYREDPIGPMEAEALPSSFAAEPEPETQAPLRRYPVALASCSVCGARTSRDCRCDKPNFGKAPSASKSADAASETSQRRATETQAKLDGVLALASSEWDFTAPSDDYISLTKGCELVVTGRSDQDWLIGFVSKAPGKFAQCSPSSPAMISDVWRGAGQWAAQGCSLPTLANAACSLLRVSSSMVAAATALVYHPHLQTPTRRSGLLRSPSLRCGIHPCSQTLTPRQRRQR